jgi:hypothetical protein
VFQTKSQSQSQRQIQPPLFVGTRPGQVVVQTPSWDKFDFGLSSSQMKKRGPFLKSWQKEMAYRHNEVGIPWTMYTCITRWVTQQQQREEKDVVTTSHKILAVLVGTACMSLLWLMKHRGVPRFFFFYRETI